MTALEANCAWSRRRDEHYDLDYLDSGVKKLS